MSELVAKKSIQLSNFQELIEPFTADNFIENYWEKEFLLIQRDDPKFYESLFSIEQVDKVLDISHPRGKSIRVVKNQDPLLHTKYENEDGSLDLNQLYAAYADGYTVVINEINCFWHPLKAFCCNMSNLFSHNVVANMYLTPRNQKALLPHYDTHDVYVLQIHGKKHWKLYDAPMETPLLNSHQPIFKEEQLRNPKEITLKAGDLMYMPRGLPHVAHTTDESSLHITIGVYPAQWVDLLTKSIQQLAFSQPELRKALPVGYLNPEKWTHEFSEEFKDTVQNLVREVASQFNPIDGMGLLAEEYRKKYSIKADGQFGQINKIDQLDLDTLLIKRGEFNCSVQTQEPFARIIFPGNIIKGPSHISNALQFIADVKGVFELKELPAISDSNKIKLAARLIRGGLLQFVE